MSNKEITTDEGTNSAPATPLQLLQKEKKEELLLCIVHPATFRLKKEKTTTLINSNYRFLSRDEKSLHQWLNECATIELDLIKCLEELFKETNVDVTLEKHSFSGYLGVCSNTSIICHKVDG